MARSVKDSNDKVSEDSQNKPKNEIDVLDLMQQWKNAVSQVVLKDTLYAVEFVHGEIDALVHSGEELGKLLYDPKDTRTQAAEKVGGLPLAVAVNLGNKQLDLATGIASLSTSNKPILTGAQTGEYIRKVGLPQATTDAVQKTLDNGGNLLQWLSKPYNQGQVVGYVAPIVASFGPSILNKTRAGINTGILANTASNSTTDDIASLIASNIDDTSTLATNTADDITKITKNAADNAALGETTAANANLEAVAIRNWTLESAEDYAAATRIRDKCMPWADTPQIENDLIALKVPGHGIVGYAEFAEGYVFENMAVLPEFRAYSKVLIADVLKYMRESGGTFSSCLKEDTSYKLFRSLEKDGYVALTVVDKPVITAGRPTMYHVTIKVLNKEFTGVRK